MALGIGDSSCLARPDHAKLALSIAIRATGSQRDSTSDLTRRREGKRSKCTCCPCLRLHIKAPYSAIPDDGNHSVLTALL